MAIHRYPGVKPFVSSESTLFFGRENDIEDILDLILVEKLVVLFGKSGYGKSSLLNAGVLPQLTKDMIPLVVRLGAYTQDKSQTPLASLLACLSETVENTKESTYLQAIVGEQKLWYHFKRKQNAQNQAFLLIFDQFEEFDAYPETEKAAFKTQLAELLYTRVPQNVRDAADNLGETERKHLAKALEIKVVFAIRSDRMVTLDYLKDKIPAILYKRYELKALSPKQASEAITRPASLKGDFSSPTFSYSPESLDLILKELSKTQTGNQTTIEAFQLQILCEYIEGKVRERKEKEITIQLSDLPNIANIYEEYYQQKLSQLTEKERTAAQSVIEDGLLYEDATSGEARRLSVDSEDLVTRFADKGMTQVLLKRLESTFLLRREPNTLGGFNYEICHDTLIKPILISKRERKEKEYHQASEQKRLEAEQKLQAEARKREEAEQLTAEAIHQKKRVQVVASIAILLLFISIGIGLWAWKQQQITADALKKVEDQKEVVEKTLRKLNEAEVARLKNKLQNIENQINAAKEAGGSLEQFDKDKNQLQRTIDSLQQILK
ncbi:MAG: hypothetical protein ACKVTZ_17360 [Bacteroidia bacterium]